MCSTVFLCNFFLVTSSSALMSSSMVTADSVTLTSSIFMTFEVDVTITTSPKTSNEHTTSSHSTPTQTAYSEGTATLTQTVFYGTSRDIETPKLPFDYISRATPTQTVEHSFNEVNTTPTRQPVVYKSKTLSEFYWQTPAPTEPDPRYYNSCVNESAKSYFFFKHRSTSDGSSTFAIVIGALAATVLLLMCVIGLLCVKRCFSYFSSKNTGNSLNCSGKSIRIILLLPFPCRSIASIHTSTNEAYGKVVGTTTGPRLILTSTNKAYGKLRIRGGRNPTSTNETSREGEEVGYELVDVCHRESPPPPPVGELEGMYEVLLAPGSPSHPFPQTVVLLLVIRKTLSMMSFLGITNDSTSTCLV